MNFFNVKIEDPELEKAQTYYQALIMAKSLIEDYKSSEIKKDVKDKKEYVTYYSNVDDMCVRESQFQYGNFSSAVIYNDYDDFASKVVHYIQFL